MRLGLGFACYPQSLAGVFECVCLCARSARTPPFLAVACGVCVRARVLAVPRQLWTGVLGAGLGFAFTPPILAGVLGCVCLCALSACTPLVLGQVCGVGVCARVQVLPAPRPSWPGCWDACVCVRAPPLPRYLTPSNPRVAMIAVRA